MRVRALSRPLGFVVAVLLGFALAVPARGLTDTAYTELRIEGMTDEACVAKVKEALTNVPGVIDADVSLSKNMAAIQLDASTMPSQATLIEAIEASSPVYVLDLGPIAAFDRNRSFEDVVGHSDKDLEVGLELRAGTASSEHLPEAEFGSVELVNDSNHKRTAAIVDGVVDCNGKSSTPCNQW